MHNETLDPNAVHETLMSCLFTDDELRATGGEAPEGTILVDGVVSNFGLHPERVAECKPKIKAMLDQLPESFAGSDGDSFLAACVTRNGHLWGQHRDMEALMVLGVAAGFVWVLPRKFWGLCPGGVPVFGIKRVEDKSEEAECTHHREGT